MRSQFVFTLSLLASAYGHAFINTVAGANGVSAFALGPLRCRSSPMRWAVDEHLADGGGPFSAEINEGVTGTSWAPIEVTTQAPGTDGILRETPANPSISVQIPSNVTCTGGTTGDTCLIRFSKGGTDGQTTRADAAGPFGGCVAVAHHPRARATAPLVLTARRAFISKDRY
ncbi:hypothetical protein FISHEDRAFT_73806 [Fistulina hepatica ATCC 64428]|uniref:Uncharacterized protein n=1 Tax=Fistulina hepatica ATCC 64428 TaxID=1128425 RepID=A0A0D7ACV1_9AGAR|nr:hypothetical protein FISHEDRAFT_73806 [Fistulina hepatica ATCC 64428]